MVLLYVDIQSTYRVEVSEEEFDHIEDGSINIEDICDERGSWHSGDVNYEVIRREG